MVDEIRGILCYAVGEKVVGHLAGNLLVASGASVGGKLSGLAHELLLDLGVFLLDCEVVNSLELFLFGELLGGSCNQLGAENSLNGVGDAIHQGSVQVF